MSLKFTHSLNIYEIVVSIFSKITVDKNNLKEFEPNYLETLSNVLYVWLAFFKHDKLEFYAMLECML